LVIDNACFIHMCHVTHWSVWRSLSCPVHHSLLPPHLFIPTHRCKPISIWTPWWRMRSPSSLLETMERKREAVACWSCRVSADCLLASLTLTALSLSCCDMFCVLPSSSQVLSYTPFSLFPRLIYSYPITTPQPPLSVRSTLWATSLSTFWVPTWVKLAYVVKVGMNI
jgi:hypothetical protein